MSVDARADTPSAPYRGAERRHPPEGCELAWLAYSQLNGDAKDRGVFERLRSIETKIGIIGLALLVPLWAMAVLMLLNRYGPP